MPTRDFVRLVVALQTISDYLDNLCDRAGVADETAFRQLHLAMTDALDPGRPVSDYYATYPFRDDGGYLKSLVTVCRQEVKKLPAYPLVKTELLRQAALYSELQTYKHLDPKVREEKMLSWINGHLPGYPGIMPWEFAAATGSTRRENGATITDQPFFVSVRGNGLDEVRACWEKLAEGASIVEPLAASAWSPGFGMLTDRFGVTWSIDVAAARDAA